MQTPASEIQKPHPKKQMPTAIGRLIDDASYATIIAFFVEVLVLSALYMWRASNYFPGHGIAATTPKTPPEPIGFCDALYFCIITFTTTGYGDYAPQGAGRIVASFLILFGLAMATILIGKAASERQNATLLLLYTSECQRRLADFCRDIDAELGRLKDALACRDSQEIRRSTKEIADLIELVRKYAMFHANQGKLTKFGNDSALAALYDTFLRIQNLCRDVFISRHSDKDVRRRVHAAVGHTRLYASILMQSQQQAREFRIPFARLLPPRVSNSIAKFLLRDSATRLMSDRNVQVLKKMSRLEEELAAFARKNQIDYLGAQPLLSVELQALLQFSPDYALVAGEFEHWRRAKSLPHHSPEKYEEFLSEFTGLLAKSTETIERLAYPRIGSTDLERSLSRIAISLQAKIDKTPDMEHRFSLTVSDRRMAMLTWLLNIKKVQISLERLCEAIAPTEKILFAIRNINRLLSDSAQAGIADLNRQRLRRQMLRLLDPALNRSGTRDMVLVPLWREIRSNASRITSRLEASGADRVLPAPGPQ